jgi:hypothetical protein
MNISEVLSQVNTHFFSDKIIDTLLKIAFDRQKELNLPNFPSEQGKVKRQRIQ